MPQLAALAGGRAEPFFLSDVEVRHAADEIETIDALEDNATDLLPLGTLIRLSERPRAA